MRCWQLMHVRTVEEHGMGYRTVIQRKVLMPEKPPKAGYAIEMHVW